MDEIRRYECSESKTTIGMIYGQNPKYRKQWVFGREVPNRDVSNDYPKGVGRKSLASEKVCSQHVVMERKK